MSTTTLDESCWQIRNFLRRSGQPFSCLNGSLHPKEYADFVLAHVRLTPLLAPRPRPPCPLALPCCLGESEGLIQPCRRKANRRWQLVSHENC
jgi:hypothetical protein